MALAAAAFAAVAAERLENGPVLCVFRGLTGVPCPGCGLTRGVAWLMRGKIGRAAEYHPLAPLLAVEAVVGWVLAGLVLAGFMRRPPERRLHLLLWLHLAALLAVWVMRLASGGLPR